MKKVTRTMIAALAVVGIVGGGSAYAVRGDGNCGGQSMEQVPAKMAGSRLDKLHTDLKLSPEQELAWKNWSDPIRQQAAEKGDMRAERESMSKLTTPERMEKMLARMKEREKKMEAGLEATRSFYAVLTPEQRQVLDQFQPFGGKRGGPKGGQRGGPAGSPESIPGRG